MDDGFTLLSINVNTCLFQEINIVSSFDFMFVRQVLASGDSSMHFLLHFMHKTSQQ